MERLNLPKLRLKNIFTIIVILLIIPQLFFMFVGAIYFFNNINTLSDSYIQRVVNIVRESARDINSDDFDSLNQYYKHLPKELKKLTDFEIVVTLNDALYSSSLNVDQLTIKKFKDLKTIKVDEKIYDVYDVPNTYSNARYKIAVLIHNTDAHFSMLLILIIAPMLFLLLLTVSIRFGWMFFRKIDSSAEKLMLITNEALNGNYNLKTGYAESPEELRIISNNIVTMIDKFKEKSTIIESQQEKIDEIEYSIENIVDEKTKALLEENKELLGKEEALIEFTTALNEQTMSVGKMEKALKEKTIELNKKNKLLEEKEEALIQFTSELNEQTMSVGKMEKELNKKSKMLEKLNKKLNSANSQLKERNQQLIEELEMAKRVQENIIPGEGKFPHRKELGLGSKYLSMESIGGDLYDIIKVGKNGYGFLMADVSGHGVPAALITTMAKVSFNTYSQANISTAEVCQKVNKDFIELIGDLSYFLTAYYAYLDLKTGKLSYTNAGHHPAVLYRQRTSEIIELNTEGTIIGAFPFEVEYTTGNVKLEKGDRILLYTDGIIEAKNNSDKLYGKDRLYDFIKINSKLTPKDFVNTLIKDVDMFSEGHPPDDDRAILYFEFTSIINSNADIEDALHIEALKIDKENQ